jgi:hypothetical protein
VKLICGPPLRTRDCEGVVASGVALWRVPQPQLQQLVRQHVADHGQPIRRRAKLPALGCPSTALAPTCSGGGKQPAQLARPAIMSAPPCGVNCRSSRRASAQPSARYASMKGVSYCLRVRGHSGILASMPTTRMALQGRAARTARRRRAPITPEIITVLPILPPQPFRAAPWRAAMVICFSPCCASAHVRTVQSASSFTGCAVGHQCNPTSVLVIELRHSKTNQYGDR